MHTSFTRGTVLIDEIDLHLHPTLQAKVLGALQRTFPKFQFIVSSHAPMVMTGVENNERNAVFALDYDENGYSISNRDTFGLDVSTITEMVLNQTPREKSVDDKLNTLFQYIDGFQEEEARRLLECMKEEYGDHIPELVRAKAMLDFQIVDDEKD